MLTWHSSFAALTGYSGSSLAYVLGLDALGVAVRPLYLYGTDYDEQVQAGGMHPRIRELQAQPLRLDAPQVVYAPGDRFSKNSGRYRVGFTMLETDRLPASWVEQANQMDEVWTPTEWGAAVFRASGVARPVHVIPLGVDAARFRPAAQPRARLRERTIFLSVFEWGERKGWDVLLRAWRAAFRPTDDVLLLLKIDCRMPLPNPLRELARALPDPHPPVGLIYNQPLSGAQLIELYQGADCFVLPTRGEGWGMPVLEAMACGLPAIATDWSGQTTFLNARNGYPLPTRGLAPTGSEATHYRGAQWAEPDGDALVELLRQAARDEAGRRALGQAARQEAERWPWARGVAAVAARLQAIGL
ncbi:glycosyltransferase [Kouleothrix sp.]|uniref:glycosyltransferase n=1 Tax=Kouleothrix sp. TaxID=2779161 RepID=UPI00391D4351